MGHGINYVQHLRAMSVIHLAVDRQHSYTRTKIVYGLKKKKKL